jgi:hypothetical protein
MQLDAAVCCSDRRWSDGEVHGDRQGGTSPVREAAGVAFVLLDEEVACQVVLLLVLGDAARPPKYSPSIRTVTLGLWRRFFTQSERSRPPESR